MEFLNLLIKLISFLLLVVFRPYLREIKRILALQVFGIRERNEMHLFERIEHSRLPRSHFLYGKMSVYLWGGIAALSYG